MNKFETQGFTLIELVIVAAIVAILAAVALPSYNRYVLKSGRNEAFSSMAAVQQAQERWRANHTSYTNTIGSGGLELEATTRPGGYYLLTVVDGNGTGYKLKATAISGTRQTRDTGCTELTLTVENGKETPLPADCWSR